MRLQNIFYIMLTNFNYQKICQDLLDNLPARTKDIVENRFGLKEGGRKTLEAIGEKYSITRERVRQVEKEARFEIKPKLARYERVFCHFKEVLKFCGNFKREDKFVQTLAIKPQFENHIFFLLNLNSQFKKFPQDENLHAFWTADFFSFNSAKEVLNLFCRKLSEKNRAMSLADFSLPTEHPWKNLSQDIQQRWIYSTIELSRKIDLGPEGLFGFKEWPEINPRNIRDKIYLVLKREKKPVHFRQIADLINEIFKKPALYQTVHNELIRDPRFVLVGRGIYALREWGFKEGYVKDIISGIIKEAGKPLAKEEIMEKVLSQRFVKKSTILFNLWNKEYFSKNLEGKYTSNA